MFSTICPKCGAAEGTLMVIEVMLSAYGRRVTVTDTFLYADGFVLNLPYVLRDMSTEDEVVWCCVCEEQFSLSEVTR
jgi:hypothetical protein